MAPFTPHWERLLEDFDRIHLSVDPERPRRFDFMLDLLEASLPRRFVALDLGSGPGPVAKRVLQRFPAARVVLVDHDTALLRVGEEALRGYGSRVQALKLDLAKAGWERALPFRKVDAALMSLAIYDIPPARIPGFYRSVCSSLRPGGVFLNSASLPWGPGLPTIEALPERVRSVQTFRGYLAPREKLLRAMDRWWAPVRKFEPLREAIARRDLVAKTWRPREQTRSLSQHVSAMRRGGFREVEVVWQRLGAPSVVLAVK